MIAFWENADYPYLSGGQYTKVKADLVYVPSFQGWYRPTLVLDNTRGSVLLDALKELGRAYAKAQKELRDDFVKRREAEVEKILRTPPPPACRED